MKEEIIQFNKEGVDVSINNITVDDIRITHSNLKYSKRKVLNFQNDNDMVRMHFNLTGGYDFKYPQLNQSFKIHGQQHNIMYSNGIDLEICNHDLAIETFGIQFPLTFLHELDVSLEGEMGTFISDASKGNNVIYSKDWPILTPEIFSVISEILNCKYNASLKRLFYFSKAIELFVLQIDALTNRNERPIKYIKSKNDRERLIEAKRFLELRLNDPPSLNDIARHAGINDYKLKRGFKELFGTTLFDYYTKIRLEYAKEILLDTEMQLSEIATKIGYSSPQHFNAAFKKMYSISPGKFRNKY